MLYSLSILFLFFPLSKKTAFLFSKKNQVFILCVNTKSTVWNIISMGRKQQVKLKPSNIFQNESKRMSKGRWKFELNINLYYGINSLLWPIIYLFKS